jgi:hypothetical protein
MGEIKNMYKLLVGKPKDKRPFGKHQSRGEIYLMIS